MTGRHVLRHGDREYAITRLPDGRLELEGRAWRVEHGPATRFVVAGPERQQVVRAVADGDTVWVHADGETYVLEGYDQASTRTRARPAGTLAAPMPASVRDVRVSVGDAVTAGDVLVMLEAMKMELPVRAPRNGIVRVVRCTPGEIVQPGVDLVEIE